MNYMYKKALAASLLLSACHSYTAAPHDDFNQILAQINNHPINAAAQGLITYQAVRLDGEGNTPLINAARANNLGGVQAALNQAPPLRPPVNEQNLVGDCALHCAVINQNLAMVNHLLGLHANPNIRNIDDITPLHRAVSATNPCILIVRSLIGARACVSRVDFEGNTPLHTAILNVVQHTDNARVANIHVLNVISELLAAGACKNARNLNGQSSLDLVEANKDTNATCREIAKLFAQ